MAAQSNTTHHKLLPLSIAVLTMAGCSSELTLDTATVLANTNCKGVTTGLAEVSLADVAGFRGSKLVAPNLSTTEIATNSTPMPLFISLSRGAQLSRGFELHLADQARVVSETELAIDVYWSEPDTSKSQPLVATNPCLVVSVPQGAWQTIEATDQHGVSLGKLMRTPPPA